MDFNEEQQAAILSDARNLLVLAGAGTGKTRTIIGRALHLIKQGTDPSRIVIVTFTRRSSTEIRNRLAAEAGAAANTVVTGTFHNLCLRIMRARRRWFGFTDLTIMDRDDQQQLMKLVRGELVGNDAEMPKAASLVGYYSYARNTNQPVQQYLAKFTDLTPKTIETVLEIFAGYKSRKRANSYLDYDDILHRFAKVLREQAEVRRKVCQQYDHVLVDEMQDTNPLQWLILESFSEFCQLFCVGDDAQSIYAFRGADFKNVHSFEQRLPHAETLKLKQNYRSTQEILDLANWLLARSKLTYDKDLQSVRGEGTKPLLLDFDSEFDEAEWIVDSLKQRKVEGKSWSDQMVLCRTAYSARPIEAQLIENKVPYRFIGGIGLLQMAHVRDLLSVLRIVANHRDELAWVRFLTLWPKIGEVTAARMLVVLIATDSPQDAVEALRERVVKRPEILAPLDAAVRHASMPSEAISLVTKALESLLEQKYDRWDSRKKDLALLAELAKNHSSIQGFLETYTLDPVSASEATPEESHEEGVVTLITVHSAKGTEAEVCFVAAAQPGNYPHVRSLGDEEQIEEERRVLYVALTRAKDDLVLTRSLNRGFSRVSWNTAVGSHYFLDDLPHKLVNWDARLMPIETYADDDDDLIR